MNRPTIVASALLLLAPFARAQLRPLPGMPMVSPPVPHPALGAQPPFDGDGPKAPSAGGGGGGGPAGPKQPGNVAKPMPPAPETVGAKLAGKDMKKAVAKVKALKWHESLAEAKAIAAATGKPILWLQALGDIDGFA